VQHQSRYLVHIQDGVEASEQYFQYEHPYTQYEEVTANYEDGDEYGGDDGDSDSRTSSPESPPADPEPPMEGGTLGVEASEMMKNDRLIARRSLNQFCFFYLVPPVRPVPRQSS
jgi:hypothetical protein